MQRNALNLRRGANINDEISRRELRIGLLRVEIARRLENDGNAQDAKEELAGHEAAMRTLRLLKAAKKLEAEGYEKRGRNAAGEFLAENIGK